MQVADGVEWLLVYWINGVTPKSCRFRNAVVSPPCNGYQHAIVMRKEKRSTIFCPYSFESFTVPNDCYEIACASEPREFRPTWFAEHMQKKWAEFQGWGWSKDYDTAALVLRRFGLPVPEQLLKGGEEDTRARGGKDVESELKKPVKRDGKRGKFLQWFVDGDLVRSVREAMAEFGMTRSNALSYLYMLQKDHGIGYALVGDTATLTLPTGCSDPFDMPAVEDDDDESWLD